MGKAELTAAPEASRAEQDERGKSDKFRSLAEKRTNKALEAIRVIGNLSNRQLYDYDDAQVKKIIKALRDAVADVENKFTKPSSRNVNQFKL